MDYIHWLSAEVTGLPKMYASPTVGTKWNDPSLVFSIARNGHVHFDNSFLDASVRGLRSNTRTPASICFCLTFLSLHALVLFW
jgi:hypothetical protein